MANSYYNPSGTPATSASGASAPMRSEFTSIAAGFALLPTLSGNGGCAVVVNPSGTALTVTTGQLALAGNLTTTGAFNTVLAQSASVTLTLPAVSGTLATLAGVETLSNKTLVSPALGTPISGILTNCTGTASGLTAGNVTTNANLSGPITSVGNVTSVSAQTGTGSTFVMNTSPTLVTPALGAATATSIAIGGAALGSNALAVTGHVLLEGVASTGATGTGNLAFSASPTFTGTLSAAASSFSGHMTIEGVTSAGATGTGNFVFSASPTLTGTLTAATSSFSGHMTVEGVTSTGATGTGAFVFATSPTIASPTLTTPALGIATGTSIAIGGATIGSNALAVTGSVLFNTALTVASGGTGAATLTGVLKGNGTAAFTAATAGTDYVAPGTVTTFTAQQNFSTAQISGLVATLIGALTAGTQSITGGKYQGATGAINALGNQTGAVAINYNSGNTVSMTMTGALTITFTNWPASGTEGSMELLITLDATPHSVSVTNGSYDVNIGAPTLVASKLFRLIVESEDGGSTFKLTTKGQY